MTMKKKDYHKNFKEEFFSKPKKEHFTGTSMKEEMRFGDIKLSPLRRRK